MELRGIALDAEGLKAFGVELASKLDAIMTRIYTLAGVEFNINSPKQLGEILFEKLGLPAWKKTKTGYSTDAEVLERLAPYNEVVGEILNYRSLAKLQSTYVEGLLKEVRPETGKVHTYYRQTIAATGRLSSQFPNLQNIPIRLEEGRKIRKVFVPSEPGWYILAADYSQIELRVLAHISQDDESEGSVPSEYGHPHKDGYGRLRGGRERRRREYAPPGQSRQLRDRLRHQRLRLVPELRHYPQGCSSVH